MIVNWREHAHDNFEFRLQDLGIVARADQLIEVHDLWTYEMLGEYTTDEIETFGVKKIPGHGNFVFKFVVKDRPSPTAHKTLPAEPIPEPIPEPVAEVEMPELKVHVVAENDLNVTVKPIGANSIDQL